jgi:hypothetical protein
MNPRSYRIAIVLAFSVLSKLALFWLVARYNQSAIWLPDSTYFHEIALAILRSGLFAIDKMPVSLPAAYRTVGYPLILAGTYALFGVRPLLVILLQVLLSTGTVLLVILLGREMTQGSPKSEVRSPNIRHSTFDIRDSEPGLLAAFLLCLDPASNIAFLSLLSETCFTFLVVLSAWLLVRSLNGRGGLLSLAGAGLALALATHVRPISYYLLPTLGVAVCLFYLRQSAAHCSYQFPISNFQFPISNPPGRRASCVVRHPSFIVHRLSFIVHRCRRALLHAGAFLLLPLLLVGGWQIRQYARTGHAGFSDLEGINMLFYRAAGVLAIHEHRDFNAVQQDLGFGPSRFQPYRPWFDRHPEARAMTPAELSSRWDRQGLAIVLRHPLDAVWLGLRSTAQMLIDPATLEFSSLFGLELFWRNSAFTTLVACRPGQAIATMCHEYPRDVALGLLSVIGLLAIYAGVVLRLARTRRRDWTPAMVLMLILVAYFIIISAGPEANSRFRVVMMPFLLLLATAKTG